MIDVFNYSWAPHLFITFLLGICVLSQTLALIGTYYTSRITLLHFFNNIFETLILCEILVFSLMHGDIVSAYRNGFVVPSGYFKFRIFIFLLIFILAIILSIINTSLIPNIVILASSITLPAIENILGNSYSLFSLISLILFLVRSLKICVSSVIKIKTSISALSVKNAIDTLHTGVLFSDNDGHVLLINKQMQSLMIKITGEIFRNAIDFYDAISSNIYENKYEISELDGQPVYLLPDSTAWIFTKTEIRFKLKTYIHISIADVSELWDLTAKLQRQNLEVKFKGDELKKTISSLSILCKEKELENARMRAHDILGQKLSVILNIIKNNQKLEYDLLKSLSIDFLDELKTEQNDIVPHDELERIKNIFSAIGVNINFEGNWPSNSELTCLFVDIIRESTTNAVRHGFATQIDIKIERLDNEYSLLISNNGHTSMALIIYGSGIGVIRKKVNALGGKVNIIQYPFFTLSIVVPGGEQYE